jgi:glutathione reductase (NADPH)
VVVGAGYIAVELAGILAELGSETHLLIRYDHVLRNFDHTMSEALTTQLEQGPVKLTKNIQVSQGKTKTETNQYAHHIRSRKSRKIRAAAN